MPATPEPRVSDPVTKGTPATFLGFDYGEKVIGVAVGSDFSGAAEGLATLAVRGREPDWAAVGELVARWRPAALVVGLPLNMDGTPNRLTRLARRFGEELKARYNLPVHMVDERLTTLSAKRDLYDAGVPAKHHKRHLDRLAAQAILQSFLNERRHGQGS